MPDGDNPHRYDGRNPAARNALVRITCFERRFNTPINAQLPQSLNPLMP
jgi:hypothetical protein